MCGTSSFITDFDWGIARYNTDGTLDSSFGTGGKVTSGLLRFARWANDVKIQSDGKIVAAGYARNGTQSDNFAVARFNTNGTLDWTFGTGGLMNTDVVTTALCVAGSGELAANSDGREDRCYGFH